MKIQNCKREIIEPLNSCTLTVLKSRRSHGVVNKRRWGCYFHVSTCTFASVWF